MLGSTEGKLLGQRRLLNSFIPTIKKPLKRGGNVQWPLWKTFKVFFFMMEDKQLYEPDIMYMKCFTLSLSLSLSSFKVFDATNSTPERRQLILDHCKPHSIKVIEILALSCPPVSSPSLSRYSSLSQYVMILNSLMRI